MLSIYSFNMENMIPEHKKATMIALKKAASLLEKVTKMTEDEQYCVDIIQQVRAVQGLLSSAQSTLLKNHFSCCFKSALSTNNKKREEEMIGELMRIFNLSNKK